MRVTLGLDVRSRAEITAKVAEATRFITGDTTVFDDRTWSAPTWAGSSTRGRRSC
ncbi:hypothetical protein V2S66_33500 [Streptomyces sp. V4-01]|uniref:Uncharacterized protein n=1 Tax=Actinacidiphila polyblastidii TaxID=3110430 RepID=A0ABU7PM15_9ACTN|nr:hypothetical protein [Streptomyces sp. V4-01]